MIENVDIHLFHAISAKIIPKITKTVIRLYNFEVFENKSIGIKIRKIDSNIIEMIRIKSRLLEIPAPNEKNTLIRIQAAQIIPAINNTVAIMFLIFSDMIFNN